MRDFRKLHVWQRAQELTLAIYDHSAAIQPRRFPGLASQLRRAAAAIGANIAEGAGHSSRHEFARFLQVALASAAETEHHLQLAHDLDAIDRIHAADLLADVNRLRRMLAKLLGYVRNELDLTH